MFYPLAFDSWAWRRIYGRDWVAGCEVCGNTRIRAASKQEALVRGFTCSVVQIRGPYWSTFSRQPPPFACSIVQIRNPMCSWRAKWCGLVCRNGESLHHGCRFAAMAMLGRGANSNDAKRSAITLARCRPRCFPSSFHPGGREHFWYAGRPRIAFACRCEWVERLRLSRCASDALANAGSPFPSFAGRSAEREYRFVSWQSVFHAPIASAVCSVRARLSAVSRPDRFASGVHFSLAPTKHCCVRF